MNYKKRVLLTSPGSLNNGGVQFVLMTIVRNLSDLCIFDVLTLNSLQMYYKDEFESFGGKIYCYNPNNKDGRLFKLLSFFKLKRYLKKLFLANKYDVIHCNSQFTNGTILKAAYKAGIKIRISHSHGTYKKEKLLSELYRDYSRKLMIKYSTNLVGCSKESCISFFGESSEYHTINNPYDDKSIVFSSVTPNNLILLQIGSFFANKNHLFTIETFYLIRKECPNALLRIVGNGDAKQLEEKIRELGLNDCVIFHKHNESKKYLFENSSYLIMPSLSEGFGIVLVEAQAGGLHCFASDTITKATNAGGVHYFSLNDGPQNCARMIIDFFKENCGRKEKFDCSKYSIKQFISNIREIYE